MLKPGLIRFLLSTLVIFYHLSGSIFIGTMAVYCFFILSGYWVTYMYEAKYLKSENPLRSFYLSRTLRIFPVYLLLSVLAFVVAMIYKPQMFDAITGLAVEQKIHFYLSNLFIIGYNQLTIKPIVPAWSLDIELQFYILLPLLFLFSKSRTSSIVSLCLTVILTIILSVLYPQSFFSRTVLIYLSYFFIGIFIYKEKVRFSPEIEMIFNVLFIIILAAHFLLYKSNAYHVIKSSANYELYFNELLSLFTIPLLANCVYRKSDNLDRLLGDMSYVLYLLHWVLFIPYNFYLKDIGKMHRIPIVIIYLISTYALSYFIFRFYDKPTDLLRRRILENNNRIKA